MKRNILQYIVLTIGTILFSLLIYALVQLEQEKISPYKKDKVDFNYRSIEQTSIYSKPDKNSVIIATISADTKVKTTMKTRFYLKIIKVDGHSSITNGYILKQHLKKIK